MKLDGLDVEKTVSEVKELLKEEKELSPAFKAAIEVLLLLIILFTNRLGLNSSNSSKPPSTDLNRKKNPKTPGTKKPGGQKGRNGTNLKPVDKPDKIENIEIDKRTLPKGKYKAAGFETRQVIDIKISRVVTEYRAQVLEDKNGNRYVAEFPEGVTRPVQYGNELKANAVYMSQFQLIPYDRIRDHFAEQMNVPVSTGSLCNFNKDAHRLLESFDEIAKTKLIASRLLHADETGINVNGTRIWLHSACTGKWSYFYPHEKRGSEAMDAIEIIPKFKGILCHDHWKPYYKYKCLHALCNAHHLRELERAWEQDKQQWASDVKSLLEEINKTVKDSEGFLTEEKAKEYTDKYQAILAQGEIECPPPDETNKSKGKRGRTKRSKARNLLERLRDYQDDVLRFMVNVDVPFTNNQGENDLRMAKVQQKISGCFRSMEGAYGFCRIRSYLVTCRKNGIGPTEALKTLFQGKLPDFIHQNE